MFNEMARADAGIPHWPVRTNVRVLPAARAGALAARVSTARHGATEKKACGVGCVGVNVIVGVSVGVGVKLGDRGRVAVAVDVGGRVGVGVGGSVGGRVGGGLGGATT